MLKTRIMRVLLFVLLLGMIGTSFGSGWFILRELSGSGHMALAIPPFRLPPNTGQEQPPPRNPPMAPPPPPPPPCPCEAQLATPTGSGTQNDTGGRYGSELRVSLHSGELWIYAVDLEIPGRGFNWKFERVYRSRILLNGPLGFNWEFNYDRRLMEVNPVNLEFARLSFPQAKVGDVIRADGYGRADLYVRNPDGSYTAPTGFYTRLIKNPDGTFVERDQQGNKAFYLKPDAQQGLANLAELRDRNGNSMRFQYNEKGQLIRVLDTLGRPIEYRYNDKGRLVEVRDFLGRSIKLEYNRRDQLIAVTSPAVTGTPNGNDFPNGKTVRYKYSSGFTDERLENNLLEITAPNEVASGGKPRVVITYDTDPASPTADRVLSLMIGGTNQTGIPAGGTIRHEYKKLADPRPGDFNSAVSQTTVNRP
jgi:YD repeat-containing protein